MKKNIALVGCGYWGRNHLRVWSELGALKTVCDPVPDAGETVKKDYPGLRFETKVETVLADPDIEGVVIAAPAALHGELGMKVLASGRDVLIEKPLALSALEGQALVREAEKHRRILMVGHVLEYHPAVVRLKAMLAAGELGRVQYLYSNRLNIGKIRTEENALWSFAPHDIALMLRFIGAMPVSVACHGSSFLNQHVPDLTVTHLRFPDNISAHIYVSWLHPFKVQRLVIIGDRQMAVFDDAQPAGQKLVLYPHQVNWVNGRIPVARKAEGMPVSLSEAEPLRVECEAFLEAMRTRHKPLSDGESGARVLQVLEMAQRSLEHEGEPQALTEKKWKEESV